MAQVAVLDDWQDVARASADWSALQARAEVVFFHRAFADQDEAANTLAGFDILIPMRERTPFPASLIRRLPALRLIALPGRRAGTLDLEACTAQGVLVCNTEGDLGSRTTAELALGLLIAANRRIPAADAGMREGRFQDGVGLGVALHGRTLGILGLGRIGGMVAEYAKALGMRLIAWSPNLTPERAALHGATCVDKARLFAESDAVTIHMPLSPRSRGIVGTAEIGRMKPGAMLVNTSRGPLVDEAALLEAVQAGRIVAALDVYDREPLPPEHPLRRAPNTVLTPHLGYCTMEVFEGFYRQCIENVLAFLDGQPKRMVNPEAFDKSATMPAR
jgi:phosphoglycerate dehydrogenase-like enzyme